MAAPGDAHLTVVTDLAGLRAGHGEGCNAALQACQQAVARLLALSMAPGQRVHWAYHFVDSGLPPHAFTKVADFVRFAGTAPAYIARCLTQLLLKGA